MIRFLRRLFRRHVNHMSKGREPLTFCGQPASDGPPTPGDPYCAPCVEAAVAFHNEGSDLMLNMGRRLDAVVAIVAQDRPFTPASLAELAGELWPDREGVTDVLDAVLREREDRQP